MSSTVIMTNKAFEGCLACRSIEERQEEEPDKSEELLADLRIKRSGLAESLSKLEVESREILLELLAEFDRRYSDIAEADRGHYTSYFATVCSPKLAFAYVQSRKDYSLTCVHEQSMAPIIHLFLTKNAGPFRVRHVLFKVQVASQPMPCYNSRT